MSYQFIYPGLLDAFDVRMLVVRNSFKDHIGRPDSTGILLRQACFYLIIPGFLLLLYTLAVKNGYAEPLVKENGPVEWIQIALLACCAALLYLTSRKNPESRSFFLLLMVGPMLAVIREMDALFDAYVFRHAWKYCVLAIITTACVLLWPNLAKVRKSIDSFVRTNAISFFWVGLFIVLVFSRLIAQGSLWEELLRERYVRLAHRFLEETCELLGYVVLFFGTVELYYETSYEFQDEQAEEAQTVHRRRGVINYTFSLVKALCKPFLP